MSNNITFSQMFVYVYYVLVEVPMFIVEDTFKELFISTFRHCNAMIVLLFGNARCDVNLGSILLFYSV